mgnify:CR=1 FL=1
MLENLFCNKTVEKVLNHEVFNMKNNSSYRLFGILNCDTVKKVRTLLEKNKIVYEFIDFKKQPHTETAIKRPILEQDGSVQAIGIPINIEALLCAKNS